MQAPNAMLYADRRGGGLGVPCLSTKVPSVLLLRLRGLAAGVDAHITAALNTGYGRRMIERAKQATRVCGVGPAQRGYWRSRLEGCFSGAELPSHCGAAFVSSWLRDPPPYWGGSDYVAAVQLRTNTLPTRGGLHNVKLAVQQRRCRAGCDRVETLCHVLQKCPAVAGEMCTSRKDSASQLRCEITS